MALVENVEMFFAKLDPKRPSSKFNKDNPTWELQIRTTDKEQKKAWETLNLPVKAVMPDDDTPPFWRVNLRKKSIKTDGSAAGPVIVVDYNNKPIDPNTIGNGSIGNLRIFQYPYANNGKKGLASVLMAVQVVKHIVYKAKERDDDFSVVDGETIIPEEYEDDTPEIGIPPKAGLPPVPFGDDDIPF